MLRHIFTHVLLHLKVVLESVVTNAEAIAEWHRRDLLARNYLVATIETQQQRTLVNCTSAHAMWTRISAQHLRNAAENQHVLQQRFFEYQLQPDHDIMTHITEIEMMAMQLEDVGAPVTPLQIMTKIICTLPPSYRSFTTSWDSVPAADKTLALLTSRLLKEEAMARRWNRGQQHADDAAFFAYNFPTQIQQPPPTERPPHTQQRGRGGRGRGGRRGGSRNRPYFQCTYCHKAWHTIDACRKRVFDEAAAKAGGSSALSADSNKPSTTEEKGLMSSSSHIAARCLTDWYADSGATQHMSDQRSFFKTFTSVEPNTWMVNGIGNARLSVLGYGNIQFISDVDGKRRVATVEMVLYVPGLGTNLLSIAAVTDVGLSVHFVGAHVNFTKNGTALIVGERVGRKLYHLAIRPIPPCRDTSEEVAWFAVPPLPSIALWHQRLAHISCKKISAMASQKVVYGLIIPLDGVIPTAPCLGCMSGKMHRSPFPIGRTRANQIGQLIHSDVCGPMQVPTPKGSRYFVLFTDDYSGWRVVYFIREKSEVQDCFKDYVHQLHGETSKFVRTLRSDNGGEFFSHSFTQWLSSKGIRHESSAPHTPEQNGVSERANRTIVEGGRCLLYAQHLPLELWAEAISCTVYVLNRVLSKTSPVTPFQNWYGSKPNVSHLRIFGSTAFIHVPKAERQKLDSKSLKCFFVGYSLTQKAYRFWDAENRKIKISRDVVFDEQLFPTAPPTTSQNQEMQATNPHNYIMQSSITPSVIESTENTTPDQVTSPAPAISLEPQKESTPEQNSANDAVDIPIADSSSETIQPTIERTRFSPYPMRKRVPKVIFEANLANQLDGEVSYEPNSYIEAVNSPDAHLWKTAIADEYTSLMQNKTWTLTTLPPGRIAIKSRWLFKIKTGASGSAPRYKARLVAKGYSQRSGIDYGETYAPVAKHDTLRVFLSIVATFDLEMLQLDIKTAFLYRELDEEIYMQQPEGYIEADQKDLVCRLHKSLYGLKQASRVWNRHFDDFLKRFGLKASDADPCLYTGRHHGHFIMIVIWVDDGLISSTSQAAINDVIQYLNKNFEMRTTPADHYVGMSILRNRKDHLLYLSQPGYVKTILRRFNMDNCHPRKLPAEPNTRLQRSSEESKAIQAPYREAVGCLMYLMLTTRPDIAFAVGQISQFCEKPGQEHWAAVKRIFTYLQGTRTHGLCFGTMKETLKGYTDSDYAGDIGTRQSTSGFIFTLYGGPVAWSSRRQSCIALSTTEAEYVAAGDATKEGIWLRRLLQDLNPEWNAPMPLMCDNQSAIRLVKNPELHQRTKHIDTRFHFIRQHYEAKDIDILYIPTEKQLADPFTKPLPNPRFSTLRDAAGIVAVPDI